MPSLRQLSGSLASALALSALAAGVVARGEVIFNTIDPTPPPVVTNDGYVTMSAVNNYWQSQAFTTGGSATAIDKITFDMQTFGAAFEIGLYASSGTAPNLTSLIGSIYSQGSGAFAGPLVATFSEINLNASTEYWVVAKRTGGANDLLWGYTNDLSGLENAYTNNGGTSWTTSTSAPMRMKVEAVPEPPAIVLSGIGLASAMYAFRRRRG
jgi:hypothetical protein